MAKRESQTINAGSMADIAFLLLIFFLVTTTLEADMAIKRELPPITDEPTPPIVLERNILRVQINLNDELFVNDEVIPIAELRDLTKNFIDNNGDGSCEYCIGEQLNTSSDNPRKAIVSIQSDRNSSYAAFVEVQNEVTAGYNELRDKLSQKRYGDDFEKLNYSQQMDIKKAYPLIISEADL